ncbi:MAG: HesA/MoeB/ThiF family protein [Nitrososphaerales archaeon]
MWEKAFSHLIEKDGEHFAFFLAEACTISKGTVLLVKDVILIDDDEMETEGFAAKIKLDPLLRVTNTANSKKSVLVEIHNHTDFGGIVNFSGTDLKGFEEFVPYVLDVLPNRPYGALVVTEKASIEGLIWNHEGKMAPISYVKLIGNNLRKLITTSGKKLHKHEIPNEQFHARQILAFGKEGQEKIRNTKVAIVGVGGMGSHVAQQLAYLGVRNFVIIDPDCVEDTNLNRLIGATPQDIKKPKVDVIKRMISQITNNEVVVNPLQKDVRNNDAFDALKGSDVIFGCVDNDGPRLILNELAISYLIPYIDCGSGINVEDGKVVEAGGQVMVVRPNGPCLLCADMINQKEASENLQPETVKENQKRVGYVSNANVPAPSVVSLNGVIASVAVTEFIKLVIEVEVSRIFTAYDMLEKREPAIVKRQIDVDAKCLHHSFIGIGDKIHLERYVTNKKEITC